MHAVRAFPVTCVTVNMTDFMQLNDKDITKNRCHDGWPVINLSAKKHSYVGHTYKHLYDV